MEKNSFFLCARRPSIVAATGMDVKEEREGGIVYIASFRAFSRFRSSVSSHVCPPPSFSPALLSHPQLTSEEKKLPLGMDQGRMRMGVKSGLQTHCRRLRVPLLTPLVSKMRTDDGVDTSFTLSRFFLLQTIQGFSPSTGKLIATW